ncbi:MAG: hypothetical protein ACPG5P_07110, partial [Saprospiraceae bacterium]
MEKIRARIALRESLIKEIRRILSLREELGVYETPTDDGGKKEKEIASVYSKGFHDKMNSGMQKVLGSELKAMCVGYGVSVYYIMEQLSDFLREDYAVLFKNAEFGKDVAVVGSGVYKFSKNNDGSRPISDGGMEKGKDLSNSYSGIYSLGSHRKIKPLGVMDLRVVQQELCCYVPGEVAHIENILQGEYKEKATRRLRRREETYSTITEVEREEERDTISTDRYEMEKETNKVLNKDRAFDIGVTTSGKLGPMQTTLNSNFSTSQSSQESYMSAVSYAKEVTQRALKRVQEKIREEQTIKIIEEYEEENKHGLDNRRGKGHVVGLYRWIDKVYKATVKNYGKRLMFEFMIPEPAAFYIWSKSVAGSESTPDLIEPIAPWSDEMAEYGLSPLTEHSQITTSNYGLWASVYGADV